MKGNVLSAAVLTSLATVLTIAMTTTAFAYHRLEGDQKGINDEWRWEDLNDDGIYECYHYKEDGCRDFFGKVTADGYEINELAQWVVDGVVQTREGTISDTRAINLIDTSVPYDPAHPLARVTDIWNLRLAPETNALNYHYICENDNVHAMLTGQMEYYQERTGTYAEYLNETEQALYQWFCDWLNGMDFENMSEWERAEEIRKMLITGTVYELSSESRNPYRTVLIDKKGYCAEYAMTAATLAKSLGLKSAISGSGNHAVYYICVDGVAYGGSNGVFSLGYERQWTAWSD